MFFFLYRNLKPFVSYVRDESDVDEESDTESICYTPRLQEHTRKISMQANELNKLKRVSTNLSRRFTNSNFATPDRIVQLAQESTALENASKAKKNTTDSKHS